MIVAKRKKKKEEKNTVIFYPPYQGYRRHSIEDYRQVAGSAEIAYSLLIGPTREGTHVFPRSVPDIAHCPLYHNHVPLVHSPASCLEQLVWYLPQ